MNTLKQISLLLLFSSMIVLPAQATDSAKEQRWAEQIMDSLVDGDPEWLEADGKKFLSIYTPATTENTTGAIILLHGRGAHPDWPQVIYPLRSQFPDKGWATLSLQMPILSNEAGDNDYVPLFNEAPARINAGLTFLAQKNISNIVLLGHSLGATMATDYLARHSDTRIKAFVGIGMKAKPQPAEYHMLDNAESLARINLPILDIYGSLTIKAILDYGYRRAYVVNQTGHAQSRQIILEGTDHYFRDGEDKLIENIYSWLDETTVNKNLSVVNNKPR